MFDRSIYIKTLLPVAEEAGVSLALHPDDPPVQQLGGVARIFNSFEGFKRAMEIGDSPNHGLDFCHGSWSIDHEKRAHAQKNKKTHTHDDRSVGI